MLRTLQLSLLLVWLGSASGVQATTFFVTANGSANGSCSVNQPCREIRQALSLLGPGDMVSVGNGQYQGFTVRDTSGSATQPIVIQAQGSNVVIMPTTDRPALENRDNIFITFSDYVVLDGLRSFNAPRSGLRIDSSHHVTVRNCVFGDNQTWGIFTNHANNILLERNVTYGSLEQHGIYFSNSADNPTIRHNRIYANAQNGIHMNGDLSAGGTGGVTADGVISGARVEANIIYDNGRQGGGGINMDGVQNSVIANNILFNNHASGIIAYRIDGGAGPRNLTIAHNTIDMASDARYALQLSETLPGNVLRHNILATRSTRRGGLAYGVVADVANVSSSHNIFAGNPIVAFNDWEVRKTLAQWQAENASNEVGSQVATVAGLFIAPNTADLAVRDYHLRAGAAAINAGIEVSVVPLDIDGAARNLAPPPDIGADEYALSGPNPNPNPGSDQPVITPVLLLLLED